MKIHNFSCFLLEFYSNSNTTYRDSTEKLPTGFTLSLVILRQKEREKSTATNIIHKSNTIIRFQFSDVITMTSYSFKTKTREMVWKGRQLLQISDLLFNSFIFIWKYSKTVLKSLFSVFCLTGCKHRIGALLIIRFQNRFIVSLCNQK